MYVIQVIGLGEEAFSEDIMFMDAIFIEDYDPFADDTHSEWHIGGGVPYFTADMRKAKAFADIGMLLSFIQQQPPYKPFRDDGEPNRPLKAFACVYDQDTAFVEKRGGGWIRKDVANSDFVTTVSNGDSSHAAEVDYEEPHFTGALAKITATVFSSALLRISARAKASPEKKRILESAASKIRNGDYVGDVAHGVELFRYDLTKAELSGVLDAAGLALGNPLPGLLSEEETMVLEKVSSSILESLDGNKTTGAVFRYNK